MPPTCSPNLLKAVKFFHRSKTRFFALDSMHWFKVPQTINKGYWCVSQCCCPSKGRQMYDNISIESASYSWVASPRLRSMAWNNTSWNDMQWQTAVRLCQQLARKGGGINCRSIEISESPQDELKWISPWFLRSRISNKNWNSISNKKSKINILKLMYVFYILNIFGVNNGFGLNVFYYLNKNEEHAFSRYLFKGRL